MRAGSSVTAAAEAELAGAGLRPERPRLAVLRGCCASVTPLALLVPLAKWISLIAASVTAGAAGGVTAGAVGSVAGICRMEPPQPLTGQHVNLTHIGRKAERCGCCRVGRGNRQRLTFLRNSQKQTDP